LKEKDLDKKTRTRKIGQPTDNNTQSGLAQVSNVGHLQ
jgi:hypothetical protein